MSANNIEIKKITDLQLILNQEALYYEVSTISRQSCIKTAGGRNKDQTGIILTSSAQEKPQEAEVVAVGPGTEDVKMEVSVGQKVIYSKYAGTNVKMEEEEYIIVKQSDILAIVE